MTAPASPHPHPRVLFVAETVTLAHAARPYMLACALKGLPYDVHMAWSPRYESLFAIRPFTEHTLDTIPSQQFITALAKGRPVYTTETLHRYVNDDLRLLKAVQPDIVIGDFRLSLSVSARLQNVPYVTLSNAYWSPYAATRYPIPQHPLTRLVGVRCAQKLFDLSRGFVFKQHAKPLNTVRKAFGLPAIEGDMRQAYTDADHTWYVDVPGQTAMPDLPATHQFLGPLPWSPPLDVPAWWADLPRDKPIVYVSLGSSGRGDLLPMLINTLSVLPITVLVATAGLDVPRHLPANVFAAPYLPGDRANAIAALTIGNGGSPITQQALAHATPVLAIPSNLDQYLNMEGVTACGAGRTIRSEHVNPQRIAAAVESMVRDEALKQHATRFQDEIRRFPAEERFKTFLSKILARKVWSAAA